jgi:hypothetical protein
VGLTFLPIDMMMRSFLRPVMQEPVRVQLAEVTGAQPAAVGGDRHLAAGQRATHDAAAVIARRVRRRSRAR